MVDSGPPSSVQGISRIGETFISYSQHWPLNSRANTPNFDRSFVPMIRLDPEIVYESLYDQMRRLIVQSLDESQISTAIVIDRLDVSLEFRAGEL